MNSTARKQRPAAQLALPFPRPASGLPASPALAARLDAIDKTLTRLLQEQGARSERDDAYRRYETSGEGALPMTCQQVAYVLSTTTNAVRQMVSRGRLKRRTPADAGFHPDDVRAAVAATTGGNDGH